jgi:archaellin
MSEPPANSVVINYTDSNGLNKTDLQNWTATLVGAERGVATMLDTDEQMIIDVTLPTNTLAGYDSFTLQIVPPQGAAITIARTLPGAIGKVNDLH